MRRIHFGLVLLCVPLAAGCEWLPINDFSTQTPPDPYTWAPTPDPSPTRTPATPTATSTRTQTPTATSGDGDGDGELAPADCDDGDASINTSAREDCDDGVDNDCDGVVDELVSEYFYRDEDGDGFGVSAPLTAANSCQPPEGYADNKDDCDDTTALINPDAAELVCNGIDDDCDAATSDTPDQDADGFDVCDGSIGDGKAADCKDTSASINPGAYEVYNAVDDNCDGLLLIDQTEFVMGSDEGEGDADEAPEHIANPRPFYIMQTEVSVGEWAACQEAGACEARSSGIGCNSVADGEDLPANCVTRARAAAYCAWVGLALPSETQWERAARGDCQASPIGCDVAPQGSDLELDEPVYPWGNIEPSCERVNFLSSTGQCDTSDPYTSSVVGTYSGAAPTGALNMAGNVAEWVSDCYHPSYTGAPTDGRSWDTGACDQGTGIVRGGGYSSPAAELRVSARQAMPVASNQSWIGVRCALALEVVDPTPTPTPTASQSPSPR